MLALQRLLVFVALFLLGVSGLPSPAVNGSIRLQPRATSYTSCNIPGKVVAMTFDDGPYIYNEQLVDYLNAQGVPATFFINGNNYDCIYDAPYPSYIKHLFASGHQIGSHTWSHPNLETLTDDEVVNELVRIDEAIVYLLGVKPRYFRPPFGDINAAIDAAVQAQGQIPVTWNFDSGDSTGATVAASIAAYSKWIQTGGGLIALNHETYPGTVNSLVESVIPMLKAAGYTFVTIEECLGLGSAYMTPTGPPGPGHC